MVRVRTKLGRRVCRTDKLFLEKIETVPSKRRQFEGNFFIPCSRARLASEAEGRWRVILTLKYNVTFGLEARNVLSTDVQILCF